MHKYIIIVYLILSVVVISLSCLLTLNLDMFIFMFVCITLPHIAIVIMELSEIKIKGLIEKCCLHFFSAVSHMILFILAGNDDMHES